MKRPLTWVIWGVIVLLAGVVLIAIGAPELLLGIVVVIAAVTAPLSCEGLSRVSQESFDREYAKELGRKPR